jgi:tetratricopeptide (TPR) repeat protein
MTANMKHSSQLIASFISLLLFLGLPSVVWPRTPQEPRLIRDTDISEGKDVDEAETAKEPNPKLAVQNVNIGNYYLKQKNYDAAIQRFLEAIAYQVDLKSAYEGLGRAYEKNGDVLKAINVYKGFLEKNPDSPNVSDFRTKIAKLERKAN